MQLPQKKTPARSKGNALATWSIVYQTTVQNLDKNSEETYVGLTEGSFKSRYLNHTSTFRNEKSKHATELSKHIWWLKESKRRYSIKWRIVKKCQPCSNKTKRCNLCSHEKFVIICQPELSSLNKRNELVSICGHRKKHIYCVIHNPHSCFHRM